MVHRRVRVGEKLTKCKACKELIIVGEFKLSHHISYNPEITVPVHVNCHAKIHHGTDFHDLQPSPKQLIKYYYNKRNIFLFRWENNLGKRKSFSITVPKFFKKIDSLHRYYKRLESKTLSSRMIN